jgi:hypothetical protein
MRHVLRCSLGVIVGWSTTAGHLPSAFALESALPSTIKLAAPIESTRDDAPALPQAIADLEPREPETNNPAPAVNQSPPAGPAFPGQSQVAPSISSRTRMPAGFYPNANARATLNQMPGPTPVQSMPRSPQTRRAVKPFENVQSEPAISPYLTLYGTGTTSGNQVQNYFAFVRPQLDQIDANRQQQREIQQLRTQMQKISSQSNSAAPQSAANMGMSAHYMDTAQFYQRQR